MEAWTTEDVANLIAAAEAARDHARAVYALVGFLVDCVLIAFGMWCYRFWIRNREQWETREDSRV